MSQPGSQIPPLINLSNCIIFGGTFNQHIAQHQHLRSGERAGYARLVENVAPNALYDSGHVVDPPKCHPNTRVAIIRTIIDWSSRTTVDKEMNAKPILWLKGGAGAGKSAIARSVAEQCSKEGLLFGTFFFGAADTTRNHVGRLVATLAYQMCIVFPQIRDVVTTVIEDDPIVFSRSLSTQFTSLVIRPLSIILASHSGLTEIPRLIIIDGLDECSASIDSQRDLLVTLQEASAATSPIRFLVCSRPESHLNSAFSSSRMAKVHYKIFLDDDYSATKDIKLYLQDKFREIKEGHLFKHKLPTTWPSSDIIWDLVNNSSGQFIYASTVVRYVESPRHRPDQRLDAALNLRPPFKDLPFTELDALYRHIISRAEDPTMVLDILSFPLLYEDFYITNIEKILQLEEGDVEVMLADLQSLVTIESDMICFLHKSLSDFLCDSQRAGELYLDKYAVRQHHSARAISAVSTTFKQDGIQALTIASWFHVACDLIKPFLPESRSTIHGFNGEKATGYVSSDFLQAAQQFPIFDIIKQIHTVPARCVRYLYTDWWIFLSEYLTCLRFVVGVCTNSFLLHANPPVQKDIQDSARLIYLQQIRHYYEAVLSLLEDELSNDWQAHFTYTYYHLLGPHLRRPSTGETLEVRRFFRRHSWEDGTLSLSDFMYHISSHAKVEPGSRCFNNYLSDILEVSNDLTKGAKREAIFALSASFCQAFLCDNRSTSRDTRRIFKTTALERSRRRDHPWRWRRMIRPRLRFLGNQPVITRSNHMGVNLWKERLGNMRKAFRIVKTCSEGLQNKLYTIPEFLLINKCRRDEWLRKRYYVIGWAIHEENYSRLRRTLPARYQRKQEWPMFMLLLDLLPRILSSSGRYEPLITMCRTKCLASLSRCWPKKSRRARQAIEAYLQRMDSEESK